MPKIVGYKPKIKPSKAKKKKNKPVRRSARKR